MQKYSILVQYSKEDDCYIASVPELIGCMAHGESYGEAVQEIQNAMQLHVKIILEAGQQLPPPKLYA